MTVTHGRRRHHVCTSYEISNSAQLQNVRYSFPNDVGELEGMVGDKGLEPLTSPV
jgi:hypothetical protein